MVAAGDIIFCHLTCQLVNILLVTREQVMWQVVSG